MESKTTSEAKWDWIPCNYNLKREITGKTVFWNLSPSIILTNPSGSGPDPNVKLFIDTEKSLQFSNDLGWNWHKSWNLPNISVRLEIKDSVTGELLLSPKNLYSHLFAVKAVLDHKDNFHLVDIGLRGVNKIELLDGHAFFSAIKFSSTSYNNEGVKFHLVLSLYIMGEDDTTPKMLNSTISPPIFVDSRKSARDSQVLMEKKMSSFVEPFLPENLEKIFIKRENKRKNDIEIQIYNDVDGLFNYLTAPNIRHKVKHPLFLSLKFSKCVKLFYNSKIISNDSLEELIESLQKQLCEDHKSKKPQNVATSNLSNENRSFLLLFEETGDSFKTKKIIEAVEPIQSPSFGLLYSKSQLPENFIEVTNIPEMINLYRKNFANLFSASKIRRQSMLDKDDSDDDSRSKSGSESESDDEDCNPPPSKKIKSNIESCQNLAGLDSNVFPSGLKDPFSLLKDKNETTNLIDNLDGKDDDKSSSSGQNEAISKSKVNENEEEKNVSDTSKSEIHESGKKTATNEAQKRMTANTASKLLTQPNSATQSASNMTPNINQQNFNNNQSNMNILSFLDTLNRTSGIPSQPNQNMMNPFNNPALMALFANNQNPLNMLNAQKNLANLLNPNPQPQQPQPQENSRDFLLKALQKNNPAQNPQNPNLSNFGMNNFSNYAMLNSLLMNPGGGVPNTQSQFNIFDNLFGNNQPAMPEPPKNSNTSNNNQNNRTNLSNNANNNANWSNANNANSKQNEALMQMTLNNLLMKNNPIFQNPAANLGNSQGNNPMNVGGGQDNNNYLKNLLMQALKGGNNPNANNPLFNLASFLGKNQENNGIIKKEEEK